MAKVRSVDGIDGPIRTDHEFDHSGRRPRDYLYIGDNNTSEVLNKTVAHIESLKVKVLEWPGLDEKVRHDFFRELDALRGSFLQCTMLSRRSSRAADKPPEAERATGGRRNELKLQGIIGRSPRIQKILKIVAKVAATEMTVLMEGETGSGKELFARMIHHNSKRVNFVAVNCGAFPSGIIESELFGHVKGSFTGATTGRKGKFEEADQGTIFLDEIGELEMSAQVKLLRTLESGDIQRVGSDSTYKTNVRVIAATNRDLAKMVGEGTFREDLYYRLNICPLFIPPLRERRDEIRILTDYFFQEICGPQEIPVPALSRDLQKFVYELYDFPGNIRELKNMVYYLAHISDGQTLSLNDLPEHYRFKHASLQREQDRDEQDASQLIEARSQAERDYLVTVLKKHQGNVTRVCQEVQLSRSRLYQLFSKHQIEPTKYR